MCSSKGETRDIACLGQFIDKDAISGQGVANSAKPFQLGAKPLPVFCLAPGFHLGDAGGPVGGGINLVVNGRHQQRQGVRKPCMNANIRRGAASDLRLVDIDMDDLHRVITTPGHHLALKTCAKPYDQIDFRPQAVRHRHADRQQVIEGMTPCPVRNATTAAPIRRANACTASASSCAPPPTTIIGARAAAIKPGSFVNRRAVRLGCSGALRDEVGQRALDGLCPEIDGNLQSDRLRSPRHKITKGSGDRVGSIRAAGDPVRRFRQPFQNADLVEGFHAEAHDPFPAPL